MATINPFDLHDGDDNEDPSQLIAAKIKVEPAPKKAPAAQPVKSATLPTKPLPPAQMRKAKVLYTKDSKFDHVWDNVKNFEKFKDCSSSSRTNPSINYASSESENSTPDSVGQASPGISSFSLNLDNSDTGSPSERPIGVKKAKLKRKNDDTTLVYLDEMRETQNKIIEEMKKTNEYMQIQVDIQNKRYALKKIKEDNKILRQDLSKIQDPNVRAYIHAEQRRIMQERNQENQPDPFTYFNNFLGNGTNLLDY